MTEPVLPIIVNTMPSNRYATVTREVAARQRAPHARVRVPVQPHPVVARAIHRPENTPADQDWAAVDGVSHADRVNDFWDMISTLKWGTQNMTRPEIRAWYQAKTGTQKIVFAEIFNEMFQQLIQRASAERCFEQKKEHEWHGVISHAIAMGRDTYHTVLNDSSWMYILMDGENYRSFHYK